MDATAGFGRGVDQRRAQVGAERFRSGEMGYQTPTEEAALALAFGEVE